MKNKLYLLLIIGIVLALAMVSAESNENIDSYFDIVQTKELVRPCIYNGTVCPSNVVCNITVLYPNQSILVNNMPMTYQTYGFNLTLPRLDNCESDCGNYPSEMTCSYLGIGGSKSFDVIITPTGDERTTSFALMLMLSSALFLILGVTFKSPILGLISGILFLITGVYLMIYGYSNINDTYTQALAITSLGFGIIFFVFSAYEFFASSEDGVMISESDD